MCIRSRKFDTVMLAVSLFCVSGAILAYNLHTIGGGELAVSLTELMEYAEPEASLISVYTEANLTASGDAVQASALPTEPLRSYELLEPVVKPPLG